MKNKYILACATLIITSASYAQSAFDAYRLSQPDLKGTARFMGMAGAFGALGGDLSSLSQNPGGIGVYRNSDIGFTLDLDLQSSTSSPSNNVGNSTVDQTKFLLNNIGAVWTIKLPSESCPNINVGFTYNKTASFNRRYRGTIGLTNSLSNYIAGVTTQGGYQEGQLIGDSYNNWNPYNPPANDTPAPWLSILGYQSYLFALQPQSESPDVPYYRGQWESGFTSGMGFFDVMESGGVDSYNIAFGGNISNVFFWGMDFDITHINYRLETYWEETLNNAFVEVGEEGQLQTMPAQWGLSNYYRCTGTGFNYKLGFIIKPIQQLRLGFAFQTPTWYGLNEAFNAYTDYSYNNEPFYRADANDGMPGYNDVDFRSPWKITASAAAVLFNRLIVSADYEWTQYKKMKYSLPTYGGDYWYPDGYYPWEWDYYTNYNYISEPYADTNANINKTYQNTNTLRLGAEFMITPQFSVRGGYSFVSAPVKSEVNSWQVETAGTIPNYHLHNTTNYRLDNTTNYITCGLGYRYKAFYLDLAYVYKKMSSTYHAFSNWAPNEDMLRQEIFKNYPVVQSQTSSVSFSNNQIVLSAGFKF